MTPRYIRIVDSDPTAALVTQLGLQARLDDDIDVTVAPGTGRHQSRNGWYDDIDLLIVDPGAQTQAAIRLIKTLKATCPQTPILVLTAYDSPLLRSQMQRLGVQHYLAKPIDLEDLEQVVRYVLATSRDPVT